MGIRGGFVLGFWRPPFRVAAEVVRVVASLFPLVDDGVTAAAGHGLSDDDMPELEGEP